MTDDNDKEQLPPPLSLLHGDGKRKADALDQAIDGIGLDIESVQKLEARLESLERFEASLFHARLKALEGIQEHLRWISMSLGVLAINKDDAAPVPPDLAAAWSAAADKEREAERMARQQREDQQRAYREQLDKEREARAAREARRGAQISLISVDARGHIGCTEKEWAAHLDHQRDMADAGLVEAFRESGVPLPAREWSPWEPAGIGRMTSACFALKAQHPAEPTC